MVVWSISICIYQSILLSVDLSNLFISTDRYGTSLVAQRLKCLPAMWETWV